MPAQVLIVEDEFLVAHEMRAILEDGGYSCVGIVADLPAAAPFFEVSLDIALVDLNLRDGLTGPEIGARLARAGVPVIFVTANPAQLGEGVAGAVGVLTKPTDPDSLIDAVRYALGRRKGDPVTPPHCLRLFA